MRSRWRPCGTGETRSRPGRRRCGARSAAASSPRTRRGRTGFGLTGRTGRAACTRSARSALDPSPRPSLPRARRAPRVPRRAVAKPDLWWGDARQGARKDQDCGGSDQGRRGLAAGAADPGRGHPRPGGAGGARHVRVPSRALRGAGRSRTRSSRNSAHLAGRSRRTRRLKNACSNYHVSIK
jgi:hypothetical protein